MSGKIPRGHHYVWQYYLKAWCVDDTIWWNRNSNIQNTSTEKILKKKDMYKIHKLNEFEKYILDNVWMRDNRKRLKGLIDEELKLFEILNVFEDEEPSNIINKLVTEYGMEITQNGKRVDPIEFNEQFRNLERPKQEIIDEIKKFRIEQGERLISSDEIAGRKFLDLLRNDEISFFDYKNKDILDFYIFLNSQFYRTMKMRNRVVKTLDSLVPQLRVLLKTDLEVDGNKIYSHGLHGFIMKVSVGLIRESEYHLMLMKTLDSSFITSDQPVMNINEVLLEDGTPEAIDYLMPVSPSAAIIISKSIKENIIVNVDRKTVDHLNDLIKKNSYEVIVGINKEDIQ